MTQLATQPANGAGQQMQRHDSRALASDSNTLKSLMERQADKLKMVLPKHLTPDRLMRVALVAVSKSELLQKCTINSILQCVMTSAQLGLDCSGVLGSAYMVPFWNNKVGAYEAQLIPGYRGLIDLARRSDQIEDIVAHCVYAQDEFDLELGAEPRLKHKPNLMVERNDTDIVGAYMVAYLKGNVRPHVEFIPRSDIEKVRRSSKGALNKQGEPMGPWRDWFAEMCRKTAVKRGIKYLPMSIELADAIAIDNDVDRTEVYSSQTVASTGNAALRGKLNLPSTQRPVSEGQTFVGDDGTVIEGEAVNTTTGEIQTPADEPTKPEPEVSGADTEAPKEEMTPREVFFIGANELGVSVGKSEAEVRDVIQKWAMRHRLMHKEHEADEKQSAELRDLLVKAKK